MAEQRKMRLGQTDGYRYIGFQPPLTQEELDDLVHPTIYAADGLYEYKPTSIELFPENDSMDVGFDTDVFYPNPDRSFVLYASEVAMQLGNCALEEEIHIIGPGSVIAQAEGAPAQW